MRFIPAILLTILAGGLVFSQSAKVPAVDFNNPASVVSAASRYLMACNYAELSNLTEGSEKTRTLDTIAAMKTDTKLIQRLKGESDQILGFEVVETEIYTNLQRAVVRTRWQIKLPAQAKSQFDIPVESRGDGKNYSVVYVDYLLKPFDSKWKIISRKYR